MAYRFDGKRIFSEDATRKRLAWDTKPGQLVSEKAPNLPANQRIAQHGDLKVWAEGLDVRVRHLKKAHPPSRDLSYRGDPLRWHREQAAESEQQRQWFALAFHLRQLALLEPATADHASRLGRALAEQGRWKEADAAFEQAIRRGASRPWMRYWQALSRRGQGQTKSVLPVAEEMIAAGVTGQVGAAFLAMPSLSSTDPFRQALAVYLSANPPSEVAGLRRRLAC